MADHSLVRLPRPRDDGESVGAVSGHRPRDAVLRPLRAAAADWDARPAAGAEDAARAAASVAAGRRRSDSVRIPLPGCRCDDVCGGDRSALPRLAEPRLATAAGAVAVGEAVAAAVRHHAADAGGDRRGLARAAVVGDARRGAEGVRRRRLRGATPSYYRSCQCAARTPAASSACTCGSGRPGGPASRRNHSRDSASSPRGRSSCRQYKGYFSAGALRAGRIVHFRSWSPGRPATTPRAAKHCRR